ncbi:MAG: hypothetical protein L7S64_01595 [Longimicrobiales bacterium]|nr:hypothetical protein [Longimicrobiales bacterium]
MTGIGFGAVLGLMLWAGAPDAAVAASSMEHDLDRLYGRVATSDGESYEGYLRWDVNESHWTDVLDGLKEIPPEWEREAESLDPAFAAEQRCNRSLVAFGVRLTWDVDDDMGPRVSSSGIRFAHVRALEPIDARSVRVTLTTGEEITLHASSTDIGRAMRGLIVEVPGAETIEVRWRDLERVDFTEAPTSAAPPVAERLYGTVETRSELSLTGFVSWDLDEILGTDMLDGREDGVDYEIPFAEVLRIEWESDRSARVFLRSGVELELRGTNDVNRDNRGIEVADPGFGRAIVSWDEFKSVDFDIPPEHPVRPSFDAGSRLLGTVSAVDGRVIEGEIRWGNDKAQLWEFMSGGHRDVDFTIEFGAISSIHRVEDDRVAVVLRDGRRFELEDTPDVHARHRGVFVKPEGRPRRLVRWQDFDRVVFSR